MIDNYDLKLLKQNVQHLYIKVYLSEMFDSKGKIKTSYSTVAKLDGEVIDGSYTCDSTSDIRRTLDLTMIVNDNTDNITNNTSMWLNKFVSVEIGMFSNLLDDIKWYKLGVFVLINGSYSYSESDKQLSLSCSDLVSILNGDRSGFIGGTNSIKIACAPTCWDSSLNIDDKNKLAIINVNASSLEIGTSSGVPLYPNGMIGFTLPKFEKTKNNKTYHVKIGINKNTPYYLYDSQNEKISLSEFESKKSYCFESNGDKSFQYDGQPNTIRGAMLDIVKQAGISKYRIEKIGYDQKETSENKSPYEVPYDLDFSIGSSYYDVIKQLRDLYSGWQTYFDTQGVFVCDKMPTCEEDQCVMTDDDFNGIVLSENDSYDLTSMYNVTEVWGKSIESNYYCENPIIKYTDKYVYITLSIESYAIDDSGKSEDTYEADAIIGFTMPTISSAKYKKYGKLPIKIRIKNADSSLPYCNLVADLGNKNKIRLNNLTGDTGYCWHVKQSLKDIAIFNGQFQVHAINILCNTKPTQDKIEQDKIDNNCNTITYTYDLKKPSQFAIESCGISRQVLSGNDYDNIYTDDLARQRAEYENWKSSRLTDTITIETILIPFLNVNEKIRYKSIRTNDVDDYIINKISFSFSEFKSTIEMRKFYSTYST